MGTVIYVRFAPESRHYTGEGLDTPGPMPGFDPMISGLPAAPDVESGDCLALAYLPIEAVVPGTVLGVDIIGERLSAIVVAEPLF